MINIMKSDKVEFIKLKDVKVGDVFYFQYKDDIPFLKIRKYIFDYKGDCNGNCYVSSVNLANGTIVEYNPDEYVRLYKKTKLTIEV